MRGFFRKSVSKIGLAIAIGSLLRSGEALGEEHVLICESEVEINCAPSIMYSSCAENSRAKRSVSVFIEIKDRLAGEDTAAYFHRCNRILFSCGSVEVEGTFVFGSALDSKYSIGAVSANKITFTRDWLEGYFLIGSIDRRTGSIRIEQEPRRYNPLTEKRHIHPIQPNLSGVCERRQRVL